jgi:hypothetical protein
MIDLLGCFFVIYLLFSSPRSSRLCAEIAIGIDCLHNENLRHVSHQLYSINISA